MGAIEEFVTGSRAESGDADRVPATVLFVEVVGSTEYAELGDRTWRVARDRFEETVDTMLGAFDGRLESVAGDGVLATFDGPARAIRCASRVRDVLRRSGLEVRSGLRTGEVTRRADGVAGIAVHIGARVADLAAAGDVLVTDRSRPRGGVRNLVRGSRRARAEGRPRPLGALRGARLMPPT